MHKQGVEAEVSRKAIAISTVIIVISLLTLVMLSTETYMNLQTINPAAAIAAAVVVVIGLVWFKKTVK